MFSKKCKNWNRILWEKQITFRYFHPKTFLSGSQNFHLKQNGQMTTWKNQRTRLANRSYRTYNKQEKFKYDLQLKDYDNGKRKWTVETVINLFLDCDQLFESSSLNAPWVAAWMRRWVLECHRSATGEYDWRPQWSRHPKRPVIQLNAAILSERYYSPDERK